MWTVMDVACPSDKTGDGRSTSGVADRANRIAIGNNTAIAITTKMVFLTAHCSSRVAIPVLTRSQGDASGGCLAPRNVEL